MKKVLALVLMLALVMSLALPVSASGVKSPAASEEDLTPAQPTQPDQTTGDLIITDPENVEDLSEEAQETFEESKETLTDVTENSNLAVENMFYATLTGDAEQSDAAFVPNNYREPVVMQFVNGEWVKLEVVVNPDQTITVKDIVEGPIAFMIQQEPLLVSSSTNVVTVVGEDDVKDLPRADRQTFSQAQRDLPEALPEGMLVRHMFHVDNASADNSDSAVFEIGSFNSLIVKQFVNGQWVVRRFTKNSDGTITVLGLSNGPTAFFVN